MVWTKENIPQNKTINGIVTPLSEDEKQYFVARLQADPNDKVALYGLLGMDMTREEIDDMVEMEAVRKEDERVQASQGGPDRDKDGLGAGKTKETKTENLAGTQGVTETQIDLSASENDQEKQKAKAGSEIKFRVDKIQNTLNADIIPLTLDRNLSAKDKAEQELRDTARKWLKKNKNYFLSNPKELAAFEANPEQWVQDNITSKGLGGK